MAEVLRLDGALTMSTAGALVEQGRAKAREGDLRVDLSGVAEADSAALALLLDWLRSARDAGHGFAIDGLPAGLKSLAALYGVDELLGVQG